MQVISKEYMADRFRVVDVTSGADVVETQMNKYSALGYIPQWFTDGKCIMVKAIEDGDLGAEVPQEGWSVPGASGSC
jgi:glutaredoxin-related protein